jgi:hypothetical protein
MDSLPRTSTAADGWPDWTDQSRWSCTDPSYVPADPAPDATRDEWLDALAAGRIAGPDPEPAISPDMERQAALRQAVEAFLRDPSESRGAWGEHPAQDD